MKLADWQKRQIEPSIHDMLNGKHNDLNVIYDAVEKACSGGMHTNGPDRIGQAIRREVDFIALKHGNGMSVEHRGDLCRAIRKLFSDFCP